MNTAQKMQAMIPLRVIESKLPVCKDHVAAFDNGINSIQINLGRFATRMRTGKIPESFIGFLRQNLYFPNDSFQEAVYYMQFHGYAVMTKYIQHQYRLWSKRHWTRNDPLEMARQYKIPYPVYRLHPRLWYWPTKENNEALDRMSEAWAFLKEYVPWLTREIERRIYSNDPEYARMEKRWYKGATPSSPRGIV